MSDALTTKNGAIFIQPDGPNTEVHYLSCFSSDDVTEPGNDIELLRCFDAVGTWKVVGKKVSPPDPVTTTLTGLTFSTRSWLERVRGEFGLYLMQRSDGRADDFSNFVRAVILADATIGEKTRTNLVHREEDNESERAFAISAWPPVLEAVGVGIQRLASAELNQLNSIAMLPETEGLLPARYGIMGADAGAAKAKIYHTADGGQTWTVVAADPFAITVDHIMGVAIFTVGHNTRRFLVAQVGVVGAQGHVAYSDDSGATWTLVHIGGAAAGHGPMGVNGLFALDEKHIWLASAAGYIYFSEDGGQTWTAQESGVIAVGSYMAIHFIDENYGMAVGATGVVVVTENGGGTWTAVTAITATPTLNACQIQDEEHLWVGTATGKLFYSNDFGVIWAERAGWSGSGVGNVSSLNFLNRYIGFMVRNTAAPVGHVLRTVNGGFDWEVIPTPVNSGLNQAVAMDANTALVVGKVNAATAVVLTLQD